MLIKPTHGGKVFQAAKDLNVPWTDIIDMSANINPLGQPSGLKDLLKQELDRILHYPEVFSESFLSDLSQSINLEEDYILPGSGSTPQLYQLPKVLQTKRPVVLGPAFAEYEAAIVASGVKPIYVNASEENDWQITQKTIMKLWSMVPDSIFLANPANPTGLKIDEKLILEILEESKRRQVWLVVDEAFMDFCSHSFSLVPYVKSYDNLIILKSMTKIYSIPGLRVAYMVSDPKIISKMKDNAYPWDINSLAAMAGSYCLKDTDFINKTQKALPSLRDFLVQCLEENFKVFNSDTNFVLAKYNYNNINELIEYLYKNCILIRDASNFNGLTEGYVRFAVRPKKETEILKKVLKGFKHA